MGFWHAPLRVDATSFRRNLRQMHGADQVASLDFARRF
jgi:hypothetical protein